MLLCSLLLFSLALLYCFPFGRERSDRWRVIFGFGFRLRWRKNIGSPAAFRALHPFRPKRSDSPKFPWLLPAVPRAELQVDASNKATTTTTTTKLSTSPQQQSIQPCTEFRPIFFNSSSIWCKSSRSGRRRHQSVD